VLHDAVAAAPGHDRLLNRLAGSGLIDWVFKHRVRVSVIAHKSVGRVRVLHDFHILAGGGAAQGACLLEGVAAARSLGCPGSCGAASLFAAVSLLLCRVRSEIRAGCASGWRTDGA
jgi:hypothetical protein